jgi:hypothetical protein
MPAMPRAHGNGVELEYETVGDPAGRPLPLVQGLGAQLIDAEAVRRGAARSHDRADGG